MIINGLHRGGRERRLLELVKGLTKDGKFDIYMVSFSAVVEYPYVYDLPIQLEIMDKEKEPMMTRVVKIRKLIKSFKPDIIHSWDISCSSYLTVSNLFLNIPVIQGVIYDASSSSELGKMIRNRIRLLAPFSRAFVANSKAGIRAYQPPAGKSVCIYNGIDLSRFTNLKQTSATEQDILGAPKNNKFVVAMIAAFQIRKDYDTFLEAAISLCEKDPDINFLLIGEGTFRAKIEAKTPAHLLQKQIFFTGMRQDIESILQIIDIGVLTTNTDNHSEGISNTVVEYMASRKPVIATRGGGTDELVQDGINGYLIDPYDVKQLIARIEWLRANPGLAAEMGQTGQQWIADNFEIKRMTDEYIDLYQRVIEKKPVLNKQTI